MNFSQKQIGGIMVVLGLALLFLLVVAKKASDERDTFLCATMSSLPEADMTRCPVHQSNISWFFTGAFIITFLMVGSGAFLFLMSRRMEGGSKEKTMMLDLSKLDEEEKEIYELIKVQDGSMYQSDLIKQTGLSKVRISRILDRMEGKKILERKRRGMTNIIVLK